MNIKNHEIIHEINRGAITTVYKARHLNLNRLVLLKVLNQQWLKEKDLLKRFQREARISAHLQHPNIVNVYDFEISPDLVFISLEYIEGQTLSQFIRETNPVPLEKIVSILKDLLNALQYAHAKGVIHRDIKPDNILIDNTFNARITDFGLASFHDVPVVTEQGQSMGTPAYMAPEQIKGKPANIQTDLYGLGITLYEMLTNQSPFLKENTAATLQSVLTDKLKDVAKYRKDIPEWLLDTVYKLTSKPAEQRPKNAALILEQLYKKTSEQNQKFNIEKKRKPVFILIATILTVLLILFYMFLPEQQNPVIDDPVSETRRIPGTLIPTNKKAEKNTSLFARQTNPEQLPTIDSMLTKKRGNKERLNNFVPINSKQPEISDPVYGSFYVRCSPWAKVILDGDSVDTTPMKQAITILAGKHLIELVNPNYQSEIRNIEISANINDTLNIHLKPNFGYLMVKASPWAKLFINDIYKEDTPLEKALIIPVGQNIIKLVNPTLGTITDTIFVEAGKKIEKHFTFVY